MGPVARICSQFWLQIHATGVIIKYVQIQKKKKKGKKRGKGREKEGREEAKEKGKRSKNLF